MIAGYLVVTPKGSSQFEIKSYKHVAEVFNQVKKIDQKSYLLCLYYSIHKQNLQRHRRKI